MFLLLLRESNESLLLSIPTYRVDVNREADVIEEILRIYGYNKIKFDDFLSSSFLAEKNDLMDINSKKEEISNLLVSKGYNEIMTNSLTSSSYDNLNNELSSS